MAHDPVLHAHKTWINYLQPVGLVVSPHALVAAQAVLPEQASDLQQRLHDLVRTPDADAPFGPIRDHRAFFTEILGWRPEDLVHSPDSLAHPLPEYGETLRPTYAVPEVDPTPERPWLLLVETLLPGTDLDASPPDSAHGWDAPPQAKFERLLRETGVPIGVLSNGEQLRLVHAPRGETSGHITFPVAFMCLVDGRKILAALRMLLGADRLFLEADNRRLPALLAESRKYQNEVSTRLAEQVLGSLIELLRGFQAADEATHGLLLGDTARDDPQHIYGGLLTVLLRLVFLLYAEDRGLMPGAPTWASHYSVTGLYLRLREDAGKYPDTMDQRFGAWPWLLSLFRLVYTGATHDRLHLPARHGRLFDPDSYPFLEGRSRGDAWQPGERRDAPRVPDGVLWRILQALVVLDGERLSYRSLDVEDIGSVYESMMGFKLERAKGPSIAVRPQHVVVDLANLLSQKPDARAKLLKDEASCDLSGAALAALKAAKNPDDVVAALGRKQSPRTPNIIPAGSLFLQPGEERRKSGSHYTPRSLTGPIVRTTLRPVLEAFGDRPTPEQILSLKICDPAMGSGAFLVEAARQLGEHLRRSWDVHRTTPQIPPDEDPDLHARRMVAERCLYGVDKNPFAVDLAKLSLWLVTLAKDHPFTFLDHCLKQGDSLVGLTKAQIAEFRWDHETRLHGPLFEHMRQQVGKATSLRREISELSDDQDAAKRATLRAADDAIHEARLIGDAAIHAFFSEENEKKRNSRREELYKSTVQPAQNGVAKALNQLQQLSDALRSGKKPVTPFHWEIEFPEAFDRENPGFDCFTGNPPFLGGKRISTVSGDAYRDFLASTEQMNSNADLVAHFFRRCYGLLKSEGTTGLIATNTIAQGDTREAGLQWICLHRGQIYEAEKRIRWPGVAAVIVSTIHIYKGNYDKAKILNGLPTPRISAFLFHTGNDLPPTSLLSNQQKSFVGCDIKGLGFTFDDSTAVASSISEMNQLIQKNKRNLQIITPYIGGDELNSDPRHQHRRYVIDFKAMSLEEARSWPDLLAIVEKKVKPDRANKSKEVANHPWWQFWRVRQELRRALSTHETALVVARTTKHLGFAFLPSTHVFSENLIVFALPRTAFPILQSQIHETWVRFTSSTLEDRQGYRPSDCFESFPFPYDMESNENLRQAGEIYYNFRAELMIRNDEGLTDTYNRFHDPDEQAPDVLNFRALHAEMDRAVLTAYGWTDLAERATCEFRLDYEDDEESSDDDTPRARAKKKPWRYRWPQDFHDEVLARLLDLNQQRAKEEQLAGAAAEATAKPAKKAKAAAKKAIKRGKSSTPQGGFDFNE